MFANLYIKVLFQHVNLFPGWLIKLKDNTQFVVITAVLMVAVFMVEVRVPLSSLRPSYLA